MSLVNKYHLPIDLNENITVTYSSSPAHIDWLRHAVDFLAPLGTPIKAALHGTVMRVKDDSEIGGDTQDFDKYGNFIEIKHANDEVSIYEHIPKGSARVKVGDSVKMGEIIAVVGQTGWMGYLGPHLHFDVHKYYGSGLNDYESLKINWAAPPPDIYIKNNISR